MTSTSYTYDALGRKLSETVNYGSFTKSFSYTYYANGLKQSFTAPDGTTYEYAYGSNNELREVRIPGLGAITISEYQWNRPKTTLYPGGSTREYEYDALMRLTRLVAKDPGGNILLDSSYEYDTAGNIVSKITEHGTYNYGYDGTSRLTSVNNPTLDDESYSYDAVGNRTAASNAAGNISHNTNNELLMYGDVEYVYDTNGNMIQKTLGDVAVNYIYNTENRLVKVEDELTGLVIAEYFYDPFGRRLWKEVAGVRTYFFYSDEGLMAESDASGTELKSYGYLPGSTWTTDPLFLKQGHDYYFYHNDHLGTPKKLVAQNGAVVWAATYTAFGEATVEMEIITNNLRFPGQYADAETGLLYNCQRYYDPKIGRYIQADPVGFEGGINGFAYVVNNPVRNSDPLGWWVHPQQIVSPQNAVEVVNNAANITGAYNPASQALLHFLGVGYPDEYMQKVKALLEAEMAVGGGKSFLLLAYLARHNWPGGVNGRDGWHNRFVFTCKHGWIDMGHFFEGAVVGYWLEKHGNITGQIPWLENNAFGRWILRRGIVGRGMDSYYATQIEEAQFDETYFKKVNGVAVRRPEVGKTVPFDGSKESYMTAEDPPSNVLGMRFGRQVANGAVITDAWGYFLMKSHAVDLEKDPSLRERLVKDVKKWWDNYPDLTDPNKERQVRYLGPRESWELPHVRCQSEEFHKMCCCWSWSNLPSGVSDSEAGHVKQCEEQVLWGNCEVRVPVFHFPEPTATPNN